MGLPEGHPEKEGVLVDLNALTEEVKARLAKKSQKGAVAAAAAGVTELTEQIESLSAQEAVPKTENAGV